MVWSASCYGVQNRSKCSLASLKVSEKKLGGLSNLIFIFKSLKSFCENFDFSFKIPLGFSKDFDHNFQLLVVQKKCPNGMVRKLLWFSKSFQMFF